ncbi:MAG: rplP [Candidatus Magasanikbacteria bacterium]|nr:rplP [Candidatus Magasanikbacteria bacterium]
MLLPKKVKHRKWHKGRRRNTGIATSKTTVAFGAFGLKSMEYGWVSSRQIEAARRVITGFVKRGGKVWIRIFPDKPITQKGSETPMGKGKGAVDHYVAIVKAGTVMFEIDGVPSADAKKALHLAGYKLPVTSKVVARE